MKKNQKKTDLSDNVWTNMFKSNKNAEAFGDFVRSPDTQQGLCPWTH